MISETEDTIWVLTGFKASSVFRWGLQKIAGLFLGALQPLAVRGKGVKPKEAQILYSQMVILC